jgi:hypothetical protein
VATVTAEKLGQLMESVGRNIDRLPDETILLFCDTRVDEQPKEWLSRIPPKLRPSDRVSLQGVQTDCFPKSQQSVAQIPEYQRRWLPF